MSLQALKQQLLRFKAWGRQHIEICAGVVAGVIIAAVLIGILTVRGTQNSPAPAPTATPSQPVVPTRAPLPADRAYADALEEKILTELDTFGAWLQHNNAKGFIGEYGWPYTADAAQWNTLAEKWYQQLDYFDLWATAWAAGSWWGGYPMAIYSHTTGVRDLDTANAQAVVFEKFLSNTFGDRRGINLAGMEFGTEDGISADTPGIPGEDYFYEPASSFAYLAAKGVTTIRLPFRWERIQPELNGTLKASEMSEIKNMLDAAQANDIKVILDLHNYGEYGINKLGGGVLTHAHLADVWSKLSDTFRSHPAVLGYGLMNEPVDMPKGAYATPAKNWEAASQKVIDTLRAKNDTSLIFVAGYDWSSLAKWSRIHPEGWINDSANNFRYEAHHYWDDDGSGKYEKPYADEVKAAN